MSNRPDCPMCADRKTHRHCERCGEAVSFPPFHCVACSKILCADCVKQGCCGETPAQEWDEK